jgi:hypothetical protein
MARYPSIQLIDLAGIQQPIQFLARFDGRDGEGDAPLSNRNLRARSARGVLPLNFFCRLKACRSRITPQIVSPVPHALCQ